VIWKIRVSGVMGVSLYFLKRPNYEDEGKERQDRKMLKQTLRFRTVLALIFGLSLLSLSASARADDNRGDNHGNRYHYREGRWYGQREEVVRELPIGVEVESLPPQYTTVVVGDTHYYYDNNRYYSQSPNGVYVVVAAPVRRPWFEFWVQ